MSVIKFHKVPELFPNRKIRTVRTEQLCPSSVLLLHRTHRLLPWLAGYTIHACYAALSLVKHCDLLDLSVVCLYSDMKSFVVILLMMLMMTATFIHEVSATFYTGGGGKPLSGP